MVAKEPYVSTKDPYVSAKEPYYLNRGMVAFLVVVQEVDILKSQLCTCTKEPYVFEQEPIISAKEP